MRYSPYSKYIDLEKVSKNILSTFRTYESVNSIVGKDARSNMTEDRLTDIINFFNKFDEEVVQDSLSKFSKASTKKDKLVVVDKLVDYYYWYLNLDFAYDQYLIDLDLIVYLVEQEKLKIRGC